MQRPEPLFTDRHISSLNITLMLGIAFIVMGMFFQAALFVPGDFVIIGIVASAYSWLTTPSSYSVYLDRLVVFYGRPRIKHFLFEDIDHVELLKFNFGNRMWIRLKNGRRIIIQPKALEEFQEKFKEAVDAHLGHTEEQGPIQEQGPTEEG